MIQPMRESDIPEGLRLCRESGWNQLEEDWLAFLRLPGGGAFVAGDGDRVDGTVACLRYGALGWIAMMLVDRERRGRGIGALLMERAMAALAGCECVGLDATPLGEPLYRRFGFTPALRLARYAAASPARPDPCGAGARPLGPEDLPEVLERDRRVFGGDRGPLLASLRERSPAAAWVARDAAGVRGYCFGRPGRLYRQIGPLVAEDRDTAAELASCCLAVGEGRVVIDAPVDDRKWIAWLEAAGFAEERPFARMFRGGRVNPARISEQYAIAGPEFG